MSWVRIEIWPDLSKVLGIIITLLASIIYLLYYLNPTPSLIIRTPILPLISRLYRTNNHWADAPVLVS